MEDFNERTDLRAWQAEALAAWRNNDDRGIVEVVTGGGKTTFALAAASAWLEDNKSSRVLIVVPTTALQDQWFVNLSLDLRVPLSEISVWPERQDPTRKFHIMVVNTARAKASEISRSGSTLLIADECHRYASEQNARSLESNWSATIGLTATAERDYDDGLVQVLIPNLGPVIYRYSLAQAIADGVVVPFNLVNVRVSLTHSELSEYQSLSRAMAVAFGQGDEERGKILAMRRSAVSQKASSRLLATVRVAETLRGTRTIVFHEDIAHANAIVQALRARKHRVVAYHSRIGTDIRRDNLRMFRLGMIDVLVCCRALDEGLDVPEAEAAIIAASTRSNRQRIQRLGRVLRNSKDKSGAIVYTLYATDAEGENLLIESQRLEGISATRWMEIKGAGIAATSE